MGDFELEISDHKFVRVGATEVRAVLRVTAGKEVTASEPRGFAEVIVVDTSGSMMIGPKMADARRATSAAIDLLPDCASFAIVAGHHRPRMVYPELEELAVAGPDTRRAARAAVRRLRAFGGTAMGAWLGLARSLLARLDEDIRHVTLLTDGQNAERAGVLDRVLDECRDVFQCDARGIGDDWRADELIRIAEALRGQARAVTADTDLAAEFRKIIGAWTVKSVRDLTVRLTLSPFARLQHFRQVHPVRTDLAAFTHAGERDTVNVATGAWASGEERTYSLCVEVGDAGLLRQDMLAGRIDLWAGAERRAGPALVLVHRVEDAFDPTPFPGRPGEPPEDLTDAVLAGYEAYLDGDLDRAAEAFGRAVAVARAARDDDMLGLLQRVVETGGDGRVRMRPDVRPEDLLLLTTESRFSRMDRSERRSGTDDATGPDVPAGPDKVCECGRVSPPDAGFCQPCGRPL